MTPDETWLVTQVVIAGLVLVIAGIAGCTVFVRALLRNDAIEKARVEAWLAKQREDQASATPSDEEG